MKFLEIRDFAQVDGRKLMDVYAESNEENIDYFYPDTTDRAAALRKIEEDFLTYIRDDFLQKEQNRYMVLERDGAWVSALRLYELGAGETISRPWRPARIAGNRVSGPSCWERCWNGWGRRAPSGSGTA